MPFYEDIRTYLENIKATQGVENVVLTQRDGNPIQTAGVWLSKNEIFHVSAATSAIFNCGLELHQNQLKYILIEGMKAKILLSPLRNFGNDTLNNIIEAQNLLGDDNEFFIALTTQASINLGGIFLKIRNNLEELKKTLILSGESFKPPLRTYSQEEITSLIERMNVKEDSEKIDTITLGSLDLTNKTCNELETILSEFGQNTLDLDNCFIAYEGGFIISSYSTTTFPSQKLLDNEATMSYSLFSTSDRCAWFLKKMHVQSILMECVDYFQFIQTVKNGIFSAKIYKGRQKLGLLRIIIPKYCNKISTIFSDTEKQYRSERCTIVQNYFSELVFNLD